MCNSVAWHDHDIGQPLVGQVVYVRWSRVVLEQIWPSLADSFDSELDHCVQSFDVGGCTDLRVIWKEMEPHYS